MILRKNLVLHAKRKKRDPIKGKRSSRDDYGKYFVSYKII
jgi:hypothetical protein